MPTIGHANTPSADALPPEGEWVTHAPAAATQATISLPAPDASHKWVVVALTITVAGAAVAPAAQVLGFNLRDGASGAGTILASWTIGVEAVAGKTVVVALGGTRQPGSLGTAVTLEGAAAPGANTLESVSLHAYLST